MTTDKKQMSIREFLIFFFSCLKISAFTFGGGYVIVPLQKRRFCDELQWIEEEKVLDLLAMAQSSPGPVAVSSSTAMGHYLFGWPGALAGAIATILPPIVILSIISLFYNSFAQNPIVRAVLRGMQAAVAALIVYTAIGLIGQIVKQKNTFYIVLVFLCLLIGFALDINIIFIIIFAAATSLLRYLYTREAKA